MAKEAEDLALDALARLLADPAPKILYGSKSVAGVFKGGSAAEKAAARLCLDNSWLEPSGQFAGKGKTRKELYRLTREGLQAVLARQDPTKLLSELNQRLADLDAQCPHIVQAVEKNLHHALEQIKNAFQEALQPLAGLKDLGEIKKHLGQILDKVKPVPVEELLAKLPPAAPRTGPPSENQADWGNAVVHMVAEQEQRNRFQRLTLSQVFKQLRASHPNLTLGQFHDGLRRLHEEHRIRLGPYTQALATLDDPANALYLDREVKYYVELP
jgi:hypothetical protein